MWMFDLMLPFGNLFEVWEVLYLYDLRQLARRFSSGFGCGLRRLTTKFPGRQIVTGDRPYQPARRADFSTAAVRPADPRPTGSPKASSLGLIFRFIGRRIKATYISVVGLASPSWSGLPVDKPP